MCRGLVLAALIGIGVSWGGEPRECTLGIILNDTCDPYGTHLLELDHVEYTRGRDANATYGSFGFLPFSYWLERYIRFEPSLRFKGTAKALNDFFTQAIDDTNATRKSKGKKEAKLSDFISFPWGYYKVVPGDTISKIAKIFKLKQSDILRYNHLKKSDYLRVGQMLILPISQEKIDVISSGRYRIKRGESLIGVAKKFGLNPNEIAKANRIKRSRDFYAGRVITLPFEHIKKKKWIKTNTAKRRSLRVIATAYTSHRGQTDKTPFLAAWNNRLRPGMKVIAVSRDLISKYGLTNGKKVKISGLPGYYTVRDKMNKRYKRRIDIYMGTNKRRALKWGRRSVVIYF